MLAHVEREVGDAAGVSGIEGERRGPQGTSHLAHHEFHDIRDDHAGSAGQELGVGCREPRPRIDEFCRIPQRQASRRERGFEPTHVHEADLVGFATAGCLEHGPGHAHRSPEPARGHADAAPRETGAAQIPPGVTDRSSGDVVEIDGAGCDIREPDCVPRATLHADPAARQGDGEETPITRRQPGRDEGMRETIGQGAPRLRAGETPSALPIGCRLEFHARALCSEDPPGRVGGGESFRHVNAGGTRLGENAQRVDMRFDNPSRRHIRGGQSGERLPERERAAIPRYRHFVADLAGQIERRRHITGGITRGAGQVVEGRGCSGSIRRSGKGVVARTPERNNRGSA